MRIDPQAVWTDIQAIKQQSPLIHNITNFVVMEQTADSLLAIGASPVMAHAIEEVEEMAKIANGLVLNIGTLSPVWIEAMHLAIKAAKQKGIPIVLDPVGAGATDYRTTSARSLLNNGSMTAIRGNASEMISIQGQQKTTKGVDSTLIAKECIDSAKSLACDKKCIVIASGATDVVTDGERGYLIHNGHFLMGKATGMGCTATALVAAFLAINQNALRASAHAMIVMGIAGEIAAKECTGPSSFKSRFIDSLYSLDLKDIMKLLRVEIL